GGSRRIDSSVAMGAFRSRAARAGIDPLRAGRAALAGALRSAAVAAGADQAPRLAAQSRVPQATEAATVRLRHATLRALLRRGPDAPPPSTGSPEPARVHRSRGRISAG